MITDRDSCKDVEVDNNDEEDNFFEVDDNDGDEDEVGNGLMMMKMT